MEQAVQQLERDLVFHCAPSLSGLKPADLISWRCARQGAGAVLARYRALLEGRGVCLRLLRRRGGQYLLLVYRPELLRARLARPEVAQMLARAGYPAGMEAMLRTLSLRLSGEEFPHEIGLFLSYPPEDVEGFCRNKGQNCKLCGLWKVYGRVDTAEKMFRLYALCREHLYGQLEAGTPFAQLLEAV